MVLNTGQKLCIPLLVVSEYILGGESSRPEVFLKVIIGHQSCIRLDHYNPISSCSSSNNIHLVYSRSARSDQFKHIAVYPVYLHCSIALLLRLSTKVNISMKNQSKTPKCCYISSRVSLSRD